MTRPVLLNNVDHQNMRVITRYAPQFGDSVNQVLVFPTEFVDIQREYPILLSRSASGAYEAVALLGLDRDENLFLDAAGWHARYVPAIRQRGPFLIGTPGREAVEDGRGEPMIHVDLDNPRVTDGEGEPLFLPHGGNSPYLEHIAMVLRVIYQGVAAMKPMFDAFEEMGLIAPVNAEIKLDDTVQYNLADYFTISDQRLAALDGASLAELNRMGFLAAAFFQVSSLGNVPKLIDLKNRKRMAGG